MGQNPGAALLISAWVAAAGLGGPLFGKVDEVSTNDQTSFLPESAAEASEVVPEVTSELRADLPQGIEVHITGPAGFFADLGERSPESTDSCCSWRWPRCSSSSWSSTAPSACHSSCSPRACSGCAPHCCSCGGWPGGKSCCSAARHRASSSCSSSVPPPTARCSTWPGTANPCAPCPVGPRRALRH